MCNNLHEVDYNEENADFFADCIHDLRISPDLSYDFKELLEDGFSDELYIEELGIFVRSMGKGVINTSAGSHCPVAVEVWAIKVGNGYLVTDEIEFSL